MTAKTIAHDKSGQPIKTPGWFSWRHRTSDGSPRCVPGPSRTRRQTRQGRRARIRSASPDVDVRTQARRVHLRVALRPEQRPGVLMLRPEMADTTSTLIALQAAQTDVGNYVAAVFGTSHGYLINQHVLDELSRHGRLIAGLVHDLAPRCNCEGTYHNPYDGRCPTNIGGAR